MLVALRQMIQRIESHWVHCLILDFDRPVSGSLTTHLHRDSIRDAIEPVGQCVRLADPTRVLGKHHKGCLEGIFRVLAMPQRLLTDPEHQLVMPTYQDGERRLILGLSVSQQQLLVGEFVMMGFSHGHNTHFKVTNVLEVTK